MALQWYQEHLEDVVKQNERLKFRSKTNDLQTVIEWTKKVFKQLFPQIPMLTVQVHTLQTADEVLQYYKKGAQVWITMMNNKLELCSETKQTRRQRKVQKPYKKVRLQDQTHKVDKCLVCGLVKDRSQGDRLKMRIIQLETFVDQLNYEIEEFQKIQDQYLKQISYLRSMTKQLEYELAQSSKVRQKADRISRIQMKQLEGQISDLRKEVNMWRSEYERASSGLIRHKHGTFEQQQLILNNFYREQQGQTSTENSQLWVIQNSQMESDLHNQESKPPTAFSTARPEQFEQ